MVGDSESMMIASMWASMAAWFTPTVLFCLMNLIIATIFVANNNSSKHQRHSHSHSHGDDQLYGDSSTRLAIVSSLLERARSINLPSYIATITAVESPLQLPSIAKKATYTSLSRLAQSIHFPTVHDTTSNGGDMSQSGQPPSQHGRAVSLLQRRKSVKFATVLSDNTILTESQQISNSAVQLTQAPSILDRVKSLKIYTTPSKSGAPSIQPENIDTAPRNSPNHHTIKSKSAKTSANKPLVLVEIKKTRSEIRIPSDDEDDVDYRRPETARARLNAGDEFVDAKADDFITRFRQQLKLQRVESLVRFNETLHRRT